jgi:tryptophan synthase alpha chain
VNRIRTRLNQADRAKLLIPFFTAGYPSIKTTGDLIRSAVDSGADIVELGMPFSDPLADGPDIQFSSHQALQRGTNLLSIFKLVRSVRQRTDIPLVLMGYYNPVFAMGTDRFLSMCADHGVDGYIIPDLPPEEATDFKRKSDGVGLSSIFLVAPTTSDARIRKIDEACTDFVYAVTVTGVTGARSDFGRDTLLYLRRLHQTLRHPFVAGFGVTSADAATRLARYADGVVIGSALVRKLREASGVRSGVRQVAKLLREIRAGLA